MVSTCKLRKRLTTKEQPKYSIDDKTSGDSRGEIEHHSKALKSATLKSKGDNKQPQKQEILGKTKHETAETSTLIPLEM